jgi:hypothetical protein
MSASVAKLARDGWSAIVGPQTGAGIMATATARGAAISDGRMTIAGVPGRFVQSSARPLALAADGFSTFAGHVLRDGVLVDDARITSAASLGDDRLGRADAAGETGALPLAIRPLPESGGPARMLLVLAFRGAEEGYDATLWLPAAIFAALRQDVESGRAGRLTLAATTVLWLDETDREAPPERPVLWLLGPAAAPGGETAARGLVERIDWSSAEPPAPEPGEPEEAPETTAEALGRLNWSLKQLVLILVFLLIVVALK